MAAAAAERATAAKATAIGALAILMWAALALMTVGAAGIPPFELLALTFAIGAALGLAGALARGRSVLAAVRAAPGATLFTTVGLFLYHLLYFVALATAPPAEASLVAYLWPLLIVLFAGLLPGERLGLRHLLGGVLGLAGAALILMRGVGDGGAGLSVGHLAAAGCALVWSGYSVLNRRFAAAALETVVAACAATALLAGIAHLLVEATVVPSGGQWLAIVGLGLGPVGAAFLCWDHGTKHGDLKALGAASYAAPLLSTLFLVIAGRAVAGWSLALAALLIVGGAVLASGDLFRRRR